MKKLDMDDGELNKRLVWYEKMYGPYIGERGSQNWKNLFRKPTMYEWTILIMIILALFMGWAYLVDTEQYRETLGNIDEVCRDRAQGFRFESINLTQFTFTADAAPDD